MTKPIQHPLHTSGDLSSSFAWPAILRMLGIALLATSFLGSTQGQAAPAKRLSDMAFAMRVCGIYVAPVGYPPATGDMTFNAGAGCTWTIGSGDVGVTATEIEMLAARDAEPAAIAKWVKGFDDLYEKFATVPGYKTKKIAITCDTSGAPAKMVFWGIPSKSNIAGYAVCENNLVYGEIHAPPDSNMDTEAVLVDLMKATARLINSEALPTTPVRPPTRKKRH